MFHVSIREYFSVPNVFIVRIRNTARSKSNPFMCTHVDSYMFNTLRPPGMLAFVCPIFVGGDSSYQTIAFPSHTSSYLLYYGPHLTH